MSAIRKTTTIHSVTTEAHEPAVTLAEIAAALGHGARLSSVRHHNRRLRIQEIATVVENAATAREAVETLAASDGFEILESDRSTVQARLETLVANGDKDGITALATELRRGAQDRLQADLVGIVAESCREIGFDAVTLHPGSGLVSARKSSGGSATLSIDVDKTREGEVQLHLDADGFHGSACVKTLDRLHAALEARGVSCGYDSQRRKDPRSRQAVTGRQSAQARQ